MSVALSSHINSLKELLIDCKDSASKARHRLTDERLTTVMGASFKEGKVGPSARRRLLEEDTELLQHISDADQDKVLERQAATSNLLWRTGLLLSYHRSSLR